MNSNPKRTIIEHRKAPTTAYQITNLAIEICKLRNVTSDDEIKQAVSLAKDILLELDNEIQPSEHQ